MRCSVLTAMRPFRWCFLLTSLAYPGSATPASADAPMVLGGTGVLGGPGGSGFVLMCPPEAFLVGLDVRAGALIDAVRPECGAIDPDSIQVTHHVSKMPKAGGSGGDGWRDVHCKPPNSVVTELDVYLARTGRGTFVGNLQAGCLTLVGSSYSATEFAHWSEVDSEGSGRLACPGGHWAKGVYGTAGKYVDSIGLVCAPALPPPSAAVQRPDIDPDLMQEGGSGMFEEFNPDVLGN